MEIQDNFKAILKFNNIQIIDRNDFPDHYSFKKNDIKKIKKRAKDLDAEIITTEKDYLKFQRRTKRFNFFGNKIDN